MQRKVTFRNVIFIIISIILFLILLVLAITLKNTIIPEIKNVKINEEEEIGIIDATYVVHNTIDNIEDVTIELSNNQGIEYLITPEENQIYAYGAKSIAIDYKISISGRYIFKIKLKNDEHIREVILDDSDSHAPYIIENNEEKLYPQLTETGIQFAGGNIEIDYGDGTKNFYSLDQGKTWIEYTSSVPVNKTSTTIYAKTVVDGKITQIAKQNATRELARDALGFAAYDNDNNTYVGGAGTTNGTMLVDTSMIGKKFNIRTVCSRYSDPKGRVRAYFYNEDNNVISDLIIQQNDYSVKVNTINIPEGTYKIIFQMTIYESGWSGGQGYARIYEVYV